jgi:tetratricopeptide (TPR) repeat protein
MMSRMPTSPGWTASRGSGERRGAGNGSLAESLSGHGLLVKRSVLEGTDRLRPVRAGGLRRPKLARRLRRLGLSAAVAHDLFVHAGSLLEGVPEPASDGEPDRDDAAGPPPAEGRARVSLTMIVRDEEANLPACLASARGLFDETVVVDTGSKDRTPEIARSFGARVFDFVWVDDFAAARNAALARATGDYAFWLDADDVLEPPERAKLAALLAGLRPGAEAETAYVVRCACDPGPDEGASRTVVDHVRLFPRREDVRWTYPVHEQILPALRRAGVPVRWSDVTVRHTGYADPALRRRKLARDEAILAAEQAERPGDPFVLFNLGSIAVEREDWAAALGLLSQSLAGSAPSDSITRKLYALIARCHQALGDPASALASCAAGLAVDPDDAELWFRRAVVHRQAGQPAEAESCWRRVLTLRRPEKFASLDAGIYGHLTRRNLAALAEERGDRAEAARLWRAVLIECPDDRDARAMLQRLARPAERAPAAPPAEPGDGWLVAGSSRRELTGPEGDFAAYAGPAGRWIRTIPARTVVALGVRFDGAMRALLAGVAATDGTVWGIDRLVRHAVADPRFVFLPADPLEAAGRWEAIDFLHVDPDANQLDGPRAWLAAYAPKTRAIALRHSHHPVFAAGRLVRELAASGAWRAFEYRGPDGGWTVLARAGVPEPDEP